MLALVRAARPSITPVVCYAPDGVDAEFERDGWPRPMLCQRGDSLGARLRNCFEDLFASGYRSVVAIGADRPTLPVARLVAAFEALAVGERVVLGPSADGGYYLIGMRRVSDALFERISWSTGSVLAETIAAARGAAAHYTRAFLDDAR
jgi:glycosyltransferase A (GT-A) superfamily protein (DUF2064 family)